MCVTSAVCVLVFLYVQSVACRADREPQCSRFHYEEQLLEKMVRMEFNVERIQQRLDSVSESVGKLDVHGNWTDWSTWSDCSVTCDVGLRKRSRSCSNPKPNRFGDYCVGDTSENTVCLADPCNYRNGGWSSWGLWQSCSVTCGVGLKARHRTCTNPSPSAYGKTCEGNTETSAVCVNRPCTSVSFIAHGVNILANLVSAFPTIVFNDGNAYSTSTGHFTAPVDGLYSFATQICTPHMSVEITMLSILSRQEPLL